MGHVDEGRLDAAHGERALRRLVDRLPFFPDRPVEAWTAPSGRAAATWLSHGPEQTGGVRYAATERDRLALFSGRPIRWTEEHEADGREPIDPATYLQRGADWSAELDGRFVAIRYDDAGGALEIASSPLGAYPVYETRVGAERWISNNAELLRDLGDHRDLDGDVLAALLGGGWSLDGRPVWAGVRRVDADTLPIGRIVPLLGAGFDADRAAVIAVASIRALADWPGRPSLVPVTGGRDSRVVLAAALSADIEFATATGGDDDSPDVTIGRRLAGVGGVDHSLLPHDPYGSVWDDWRRAAEVVDLTSSGTASLADAAGFPLGPRDGPLALWHSGQGGEIARAYYGVGDGGGGELTDRLARAFLGRRPGRVDVLSEDGRAAVRRQIGSWVEERLAAGAAAEDVPDLFYLERRMGTWAGPTHGCVEYVRDTTSPLWSHRLLPDLLGAPARDRARHLFHLHVLERLAPDLVDIPFEDGRPWPARRGALALRASRARALAGKGLAEASRRLRGRRGSAPDVGAEPFGRIFSEIRETVLSQPDHPAWPVLDRPRVERLLSSDAAALDAMSRYYAWRLATVFGAPDPR